MRIKKGFDMQDVCGHHVIVATGLENIDFSKVVSMNESAAVMWKAAVEKEFSETDLVKALTAEYDVSEEVAATDVRATLDQWKKIGLVEE